MFFSITKEKQYNFPNHYVFKNWVINTDNGWKTQNLNDMIVLYKGYCDEYILDNILNKILVSDDVKIEGNFCCFYINEKEIKIRCDKNKSFPIFYDSNEITNLKKLDNQFFTDEIITIYSDLTSNSYKNKNYLKHKINDLSENEVIEKIDNILNKKICFVLKNYNISQKIFLSGGLDTLLIYSYAKKYANIEIIKGEEFEFDYFWLKNHSYVTNNWAYKQICHYKKPSILLVGTPGDEFMLRGPETVNIYCQTNKLNILELLSQKEFENCYHKLYFQQEKNKKIFLNKISKIQKNKEYAYNFIINWLLNDFQHHHLGNTLTFTPLRDINILKLMLSLPLESAIKQIMDGYITKKLIEKNDPQLLKYLSKYKNSENFMENLTDLIL